MLTLIALSALLVQDPPRPGPPGERRSEVVIVNAEGRGALDRDGDGQVSREEFSAPLNDHFGRMDKDGDGRLSPEEMSAGADGDRHEIRIRRDGGEGAPGVHRFEMRRHPGGEAGARAEHEIILRGGPDGGPHVRRFEVRAPHPGGEAGASSEYRVMLRGDGEVQGPERFKIDLVGPGGDQTLDADNDGRLSETEFTAPLRDAFARMDADRSGFVEEGERGGDSDVRVFTRRIETRGDAED